MAQRFKNKYRCESMRAQFWDYSRNGAYFVAVCTHNRECFFGHVADGEMILSDVGKIAHACWLHIPNQFPFAQLDEFAVMPNHVHGIVLIDGTCRDAINRVPTGTTTNPTDHPTSNHSGGITGHYNPMLHENLGRIIRWYKGRTTFESRKIQTDFQWQSRYHDHIIRDNRSFQTIAQYTRDNPRKWHDDQFFGKAN